MHLSEELARSGSKITVKTRFGNVNGRRALNGCPVFLEVPYALHPERFCDPKPLPLGYRYPDIEFIHESRYEVQPDNDGQAAGTKPEDKLGLGNPSEDPLFVNIVCPPSHPSTRLYPVKVYIHGGFLQFGSPHGLSSQAQYVSAEREEVWVNIGYRLSAFGFLGNDDPYISGNFGFKDQWVALLWIKKNIESFGGDPENIILTGLSAGAHSCHQLLHHASRLPEGELAPFNGVIMQSNAIVNDPKTHSELHEQYENLMRALNLDPSSEEGLKGLQQISWRSITTAAESLVPYGTFRGCTDGAFLHKDLMEYQASPQFASALRVRGVKFLVVGDLKDEWYLYSIAHPITDYASIGTNLQRYYPDVIVDRILDHYGDIQPGSSQEECEKGFGIMLSEGQVHLPIRLLHRDLARNGFPVLRYQINWTPEQGRPLGYVTHGTDRSLWAFRTDMLHDSQVDTARRWLDEVDRRIAELQAEGTDQTDLSLKRVLTLRDDRSIGWEDDHRWESMMKLAVHVLPGEPRLHSKLSKVN